MPREKEQKNNIKTRIIIVSFLASLPFWFGVNIFADNLKGIFLSRNTEQNDVNPYLAKSDVFSSKKEQKPAKKIENLEIDAYSAISILVDKNGNKKILYSKNPDEKMPIASLTKIMSSKIILEDIDLSKDVVISEKDLLSKSAARNFKAGETFKGIDLFSASYIESENDGISALVDVIGTQGFISMMNLESNHLGLENTFFFNATGLDSTSPIEGINFSTARDMADLSAEFFKNPVASEVALKRMFNLHNANGAFHHRSINTNKILDFFFGFGNFEIIGGKTGYTREAKGCLALALENKKDGSYMINVILGSDDRFKDMEKLTNWAVSYYDI